MRIKNKQTSFGTTYYVPEFKSLKELSQYCGNKLLAQIMDMPFPIERKVQLDRKRRLYAKALDKWLKKNKSKYFTIYGGSSTGKSLNP